MEGGNPLFQPLCPTEEEIAADCADFEIVLQHLLPVLVLEETGARYPCFLPLVKQTLDRYPAFRQECRCDLLSPSELAHEPVGFFLAIGVDEDYTVIQIRRILTS